MNSRRSVLSGLAALPLAGGALKANPTRHIVEGFEPIEFEAPGPNEEWAETYLPPIRLATIIVSRSKAELTEALNRLGPDFQQDMLHSFNAIAEDFLDMVAMLQIARERCLHLMKPVA